MKIHIVKKGETLYQIAQKYNVDLQKLIEANPIIADPDDIDVGLKVKIPSSATPIHGIKSKKSTAPIQPIAPKACPETKPPAHKVGSFYDIPAIPEMAEDSWGMPYTFKSHEIPGLSPNQVMGIASPTMMPPPPKLNMQTPYLSPSPQPCSVPCDIPIPTPYHAMQGMPCDPAHMPFVQMNLPVMHPHMPCGTPIYPFPYQPMPYSVAPAPQAHFPYTQPKSHQCGCQRNKADNQKMDSSRTERNVSNSHLDTDEGEEIGNTKDDQIKEVRIKTKSKSPKKSQKKAVREREQSPWMNH